MRTYLREMKPSDLPRVVELLKEQNERDSTSYGIPVIFDERGLRKRTVPLALVAVDEQTGEVVQAHWWEQTIEEMTVGISPEATVCSMHEQGAFLYLLRERGYRDMHILVPPERVKQMQHGLESILGMSATGMTHFYRLLDPEENQALQTFYEEREVSA